MLNIVSEIEKWYRKNIYVISNILRENRIIKKIVITNTKTFTFKYNTQIRYKSLFIYPFHLSLF